MFVVILYQIDEDLTARINMADSKFSFQEKGRVYYPAWMSPEGKYKNTSKYSNFNDVIVLEMH